MSIQAKRRLDALDVGMFFWRTYMQLSLEFQDKSSVPPAIDEIIRSVNAFRFKIGWINYITTDSTPTVHQIPSHLTTLPPVNEWIYRNHTPQGRDILATIAADDTRVVLNVQHAAADSRYLVRLCEHICDPSSYGRTNVPPLPASAYQYFSKRIWRSEPRTTCSMTPEISRVFPRNPTVPAQDSKFAIHYICEPVSSFKCYDARSGRPKAFTEAMWMALALSNAAYDGGLTRGFGLSTVVDLRRFGPSERAIVDAQQNWVASVQIHAKPTLGMAVAQVQKEMRGLLNRKLTEGWWLGHMRMVHDCILGHPWRSPKSPPGLGMEFSSVGPVVIKRPVVNAHITMMAPDANPYQGTSFLNFSLKNLETGTTRFVGEFQHTTLEMNEKDGRLLRDSIRYSLLNTRQEQTIGEAIDDIRRFQEQWTDSKQT